MCEKTHVVEKWNIFGTGTIRIVLPKYGEFNVVSITESQLTRVLSRAVQVHTKFSTSTVQVSVNPRFFFLKPCAKGPPVPRPISSGSDS